MGGKGGGSASKSLEKASTEILNTSRPVRNEFSQQLQEILQTGGSTARLPIIQQQVEGAKQAGANAIQGTTESLAMAGLDRTPFGQNIIANQRQQSGQAQSAARFNVVNQMLGAAPGFAMGPLAPALGGLSNVAGVQAQQQATQAQTAASGSAAAGAILAALLL